MAGNFDFNEIGRRMPYTVPDGFFDEMEDNVWQKLNSDGTISVRRKPRYQRIALRAVASAAAAVILLIAVNTAFNDKHTYGMDDVEQAFAALNADDQAYILSVYDEDVFMNE